MVCTYIVNVSYRSFILKRDDESLSVFLILTFLLSTQYRYRRFWQQANVHVFTWCGDGFAHVVRRRISKSVQILIVLAFILSQLAMNFESRDFHNSHHIRIYGKRVLNSVPENSILLVTEDLNNNAIKYVQECEGVRPDVSSLSLPLMTYEWWSKTQKHHYPNVVIPNEMYHPGQSNGYSILEFLLSNMNASPIFIAGSWYVFFLLLLVSTGLHIDVL